MTNRFIISRTKTMAALLLTIVGMLVATASHAQSDNGVWRKTIIVTTLDGATMEYLIDEDTKVRVEKPYFIVETEGVTLSYELEKMGQLRYGRRLITDGFAELSSGQPFSFDNETIFFSHLPENSQIGVFTTEGKQVISQRCNNATRISLRALTPGAYIVKANNSSYKIVKR